MWQKAEMVEVYTNHEVPFCFKIIPISPIILLPPTNKLDLSDLEFLDDTVVICLFWTAAQAAMAAFDAATHSFRLSVNFSKTKVVRVWSWTL